MSWGNKSHAVASWHQQTTERRPMKRHARQGPDVYPQEPKQDEDNLGSEKLKKGYLVPTTSYEHESMLFGNRHSRLDRLEDSILKASTLTVHLLGKKSDINAASLDKEKRKNKDSASSQMVQQLGALKTKERAQWFSDLARGKALSQLVKKPPLFRKKEDCLGYLLDYKISSYRALWYLKLSGAMQPNTNPQKQRKTNSDSSCGEYTTMFGTVLRDILTRMPTTTDPVTQGELKERWIYFSFLAKQGFEDGCIDRQEFINQLCILFSDVFLKRKDGGVDSWSQLRVFMSYFIQFTEQISQNFLLSRRSAHILANKLAFVKEEFEQQFGGSEMDAVTAYEEMLKCEHKQIPVQLMITMLHCISIDCPAALVWNKYVVSPEREPYILSQLCGSPLDLLPCALHDLPLPSCSDPEKNAHSKVIDILKMRNTEIIRRSRAVENKWAYGQANQTTYAHLVDSCLNVIGILDAIDLLEADAIDRMCQHLFKFRSDCYDLEMIIRIRLMLHWTVTVQREGSHRAVQVAKVLAHQVERQKSEYFSGKHIHELILDYVHTEGPQPGQEHFREEFSNMILLFMELIRLKLFSHDNFVKDMLKTGEMSYETPIMRKFIRQQEERPMNQFEDLTPDEDTPAVTLISYPTDTPDVHILLEEPDMTVHERLLIQLPLGQVEDYRNECNQRAIVLWGMSESRDEHRVELKKIAKEICKIWQKKVLVQFFDDSDNVVYCRRLYAQKLQDLLSKFKTQTFYDQVVICGWCAESFADMLRDFAYHGTLFLPTHECLDILLGMFEHCRHIYGIFELCEAAIPLLMACEKVIRCLSSDCIPGSVSGQHAYVFSSYLAKNWHYFLHSDIAPGIVNGLYSLTERCIRARDFPVTGWARTVAAFAFHARKQLRASRLTTVKLLGKTSEFSHIFFHGNSGTQSNMRYNSLFFRDVFEDHQFPLRFPSYHEYKKRLPSFDLSHNRYSFVVNAFIAARRCGRSYDRINELATFCSHVTAQKPLLADEWVGAAKALCCSSVSQHLGYGPLLLEVDINDCSTHYPIATFLMLLASKYCYSVPKLVAELLNNVFPSVMKKDHSKMDHDSDPGVCLALIIIAQLMCQTDEPFILSDHYVGVNAVERMLPRSAECYMLNLIHWCEMDRVLFPMLSNICILVDTLRNRNKDAELHLTRIVDNTEYRNEYLNIIVKAVQGVVCEQDWVTAKMYKIVESNRMEAFNSDRLKQNCLGQQLLRLGTRRKSERRVVQELSVCNINSKKALIDKLLKEITLWNVRATLFDLILMIKEISPEGAPKHAQQGAIAADALVNEIGRCCRDLFTNSHKAGENLPVGKIGNRFRFRDICNFWLISPLVRLCPSPSNVPHQSFPVNSVPGKFLKEAATMLDTANDSSRERVQQSAWLLSQQPFLQLVITCLKSDREQQRSDGIVNSLFKQLQDLIHRAKDNPSLPFLDSFQPEREGLLLRLSLVGKIFKEICSSAHADSWCHLIFQLMLYGMVTPSRDKIMWDSCYDMVTNLLIWALTDPNTCQQGVANENGEPKYRWPVYTSMVKKLKKEVADQKIPMEQRQLLQLGSFPKGTYEFMTVEPYGAIPQAPLKTSKSGAPVGPPIVPPGVRHGRYMVQPGTMLQPSEKQKITTYDLIPYYVQDPAAKRGWNWSWFMAAKIDKIPCPIQKFISRMIYHRHHTEYQRPNYVLTEASASNDHFLLGPNMEATGELITPPATTTTGATTSTTTTTTTTTPAAVEAKEKETAKEESTTINGSMAPPSTTPAPPIDRAGAETPDIKPAIVSATASPRTQRGGRRKSGTGAGRGSGQPRPKKANPGPVAAATTATSTASTQPSASQAQPFFNQPGWPKTSTVASTHSSQFSTPTTATSQPAPVEYSDSKLQLHNMLTKKIEAKSQPKVQGLPIHAVPSSAYQSSTSEKQLPNDLDTAFSSSSGESCRTFQDPSQPPNNANMYNNSNRMGAYPQHTNVSQSYQQQGNYSMSSSGGDNSQARSQMGGFPAPIQQQPSMQTSRMPFPNQGANMQNNMMHQGYNTQQPFPQQHY